MKVKFFISDMSNLFRLIRKIYFPNSIYITDKYHFVRQLTWALEAVRKEEQKKMTRKDRIYYKRSKSLLNKPRSKLTDEEKIKVSIMLEKNERIRQAYKLKEEFYENVLIQTDKKVAKKALLNWIEEAKKIKERCFKACITAYKNWTDSIANSLQYKYNNGYLEGTHNKIKAIKRITFGMKNFRKFRNKILLTLN